MNMSTLAWTGMLVSSLLISSASAQLRQPLSVQPIGFNYNNYQDAAPSAEAVEAAADTAAAAPAAEHEMSAAPVETPATVYEAAPSYAPAAPCGCSPAAPSCGACTSCGPSSCYSSCGDGCGLSLLGDCDLGDAWTLSGALFGDCPPAIDFGGWFQFGYYSEANDLFFDRTDEIALHQAWIYAEKLATCDSPRSVSVPT